jgi:hypothetical protein
VEKLRGSVLDTVTAGYIILDSSATSGNYAGIIESVNRLDFSAKSKWVTKENCDSNTYLTVKLCVGVDHANNADTTNYGKITANLGEIFTHIGWNRGCYQKHWSVLVKYLSQDCYNGAPHFTDALGKALGNVFTNALSLATLV